MRAEFFFAGMRTQWDERGGKIALGDDIGGGEVMLRPIYFKCVCVWI